MPQFLILLFILAGAFQGAVVLDRIVVIVGKHAIKTSDIQRDLRLTEFMNGQPLNLSAGEMRKGAERLIDQTIIRDEIARGGYRRPSDADGDTLLNHLARDRFGSAQERLLQAISLYGLTEDELRRQLLWQLTVLRFIDQRFQPGMQVADEDVRAYYDQHLTELKREHPRDHSFHALQAQIRTLLEGEHINQAFTAWLADARKQVRIKYEEGAFQ